MSIKKTLTSIVASALIGAAAWIPKADAGFTAGIDPTVGGNSWKVKSPNGQQTLTVSGDTGLIDVSRTKTYTLDLPANKTFRNTVFGVAPFVGYSSKDSLWESFKVGKEFSFYMIQGSETRTPEDKYYFTAESDNGWGDWPNAGVYAKIKAENILFIEKPIAEYGCEGDRRSDGGASLSLLMRLNHYKVDYTAFTSRTPFGSEWYGSLDGTTTSTQDLGSKSGTEMTLGLRGNLYMRNDGMLVGLFGEISTGIPIDDLVTTGYDARFGFRIGF